MDGSNCIYLSSQHISFRYCQTSNLSHAHSFLLSFLSNAYILNVPLFYSSLSLIHTLQCHKFSGRLAGEPEPGNALYWAPRIHFSILSFIHILFCLSLSLSLFSLDYPVSFIICTKRCLAPPCRRVWQPCFVKLSDVVTSSLHQTSLFNIIYFFFSSSLLLFHIHSLFVVQFHIENKQNTPRLVNSFLSNPKDSSILRCAAPPSASFQSFSYSLYPSLFLPPLGTIFHTSSQLDYFCTATDDRLRGEKRK